MLIRSAKVTVVLAIAGIFLFGQALHNHSDLFAKFQLVLMSVQWMLLASLAVWYGTFIFLTFGLKDLPLNGLLLIAIFAYFIDYSIDYKEPLRAADAVILLAGVTLGKGMRFALKGDGRWKMEDGAQKEVGIFLIGLLSFASWWHLDLPGPYQGPRWMGLWDNPNTYGMLMGAGLLLAVGLLAANAKLKIKKSKSNWFLGIAVFMLGVGLVMSYSRGAWVATSIGLLYLAWSYGKLKWRYVLPVVAVASAMVLFHWGSTPDSAPWYVKRADLGRPSAQNRATAWRAGLEIMRDHPLGVGWNNAVKLYGEKYHPPEGGPGAITTNDYLMLGTELGLPGLLCFVAYVGLCYRHPPRIQKPEARSQELESAPSSQPSPPEWEKEKKTGGMSVLLWQEQESLRAACLAGALVFVVAFWFDGGLFKLPTATMFWVLLELGAARGGRVESGELSSSALLRRDASNG